MAAGILSLHDGSINQFKFVAGVLLNLTPEHAVQTQNIFNDLGVHALSTHDLSCWNDVVLELTILVEEQCGAILVLKVLNALCGD